MSSRIASFLTLLPNRGIDQLHRPSLRREVDRVRDNSGAQGLEAIHGVFRQSVLNAPNRIVRKEGAVLGALYLASERVCTAAAVGLRHNLRETTALTRNDGDGVMQKVSEPQLDMQLNT